MKSSLGGLEPPTFRLTAERANRLRHRDNAASRAHKSQAQGPLHIHVVAYGGFLGSSAQYTKAQLILSRVMTKQICFLCILKLSKISSFAACVWLMILWMQLMQHFLAMLISYKSNSIQVTHRTCNHMLKPDILFG